MMSRKPVRVVMGVATLVLASAVVHARGLSGFSQLGSAAMDINAVTKTVPANGFSFPVVDTGSGPVVLLLHGFPDSRFLWRNQIGPLVHAGFRVVAPDLRGFGEAPKPPAVQDYRLSVVARDIIGILDALGVKQARVVAHDWGAGLAWYLAAANPDRVDRLVALSVGAGGTSGTTTLAQREKSWYFLFFQFEGVAEATLMRDNWRFFKEWTRGQGDTERELQDLARPGALTAALNWYRANVRPQMPPATQPPAPPKIACPVMGVWSDGDPFLTEAHVSKSYERLSGSWRYEKIEGAGHWMMLDKPDELNRLLLDFLK
jgi:pimeloyl-ACP methyl ester carboxylesterase